VERLARAELAHEAAAAFRAGQLEHLVRQARRLIGATPLGPDLAYNRERLVWMHDAAMLLPSPEDP
jgi:hypothetical protein